MARRARQGTHVLQWLKAATSDQINAAREAGELDQLLGRPVVAGRRPARR
jgi:hypothetical protein